MTNRELVLNYYPNADVKQHNKVYFVYIRKWTLAMYIGNTACYVPDKESIADNIIGKFSKSYSKAWESTRDIIIKRLQSGETKEYIRDNPLFIYN